MIIDRDLDDILLRSKAFFERKETDRPLLGMFILGRDYMRTFEKTYSNIPRGKELEPDDIIIDDFIDDIDKLAKMTEHAGLDIFFPISPFQYIPWMEAIIGCPIFAGRDSVFAEPFINTWDDYSGEVDLSENNKWLSKIIEIYHTLLEHFGDTYPLASSTHLRGPADMVSAAMGPIRLGLELFDNPEKIKIMSNEYTKALIKVAQIQNELVSRSKFINGYTISGYGIWTPKICQHIQDDAIAIISPKFYREIFLDDHKLLAGSLNSTFYHVHPVSLFVIDELVDMKGLEIVEINREPVAIGPSMEELVPAFKKIQEHDKSIFIHFTDIDFRSDLIEKEIRIILDNLSTKGMCINICVEDIDDAIKRKKVFEKFFKI